VTPVNIHLSDIVWVDFRNKRVVAEQKLPFEKMDLVREGLINYKRLCGRGEVKLVSENGNTLYDMAG
jgi:hypothetical protein